jgi:RNA polymerase sigma-70 factor (ECF subfamily)
LIARFQQGDRAAFDTLYETYAKRVHAFALPLVGGCHADAEDLVQETFIAAFQATGNFRGNSRILTWLLGIALRRFRDGKRQQRPMIFSLREELDFQTITGEADSFEHTLIEGICYQQALLQLEESQRIAFILVASQKLTHKEASVLLKTPVPTIKWRIAQATKHLRTLLSDQDDEEKKEAISCVR